MKSRGTGSGAADLVLVSGGMNELEPDSLIHIFKIQTFGKGLDSPPLTTHKG